MTDLEINAALTLIEFIVNEEPKVQAALVNIFSKSNPTPSDWQAEHATVQAMDYDKIVTNSQIPPETPPQAS